MKDHKWLDIIFLERYDKNTSKVFSKYSYEADRKE